MNEESFEMKVAIYTRVSTYGESSRQTTLNQTMELNRYVESQPDREVVARYEDHASGANNNRPQFNEMLKSARKK